MVLLTSQKRRFSLDLYKMYVCFSLIITVLAEMILMCFSEKFLLYSGNGLSKQK